MTMTRPRPFWLALDGVAAGVLFATAVLHWADHRVSAFLFFGATLAGNNLRHELSR